jgi:hypothetical protein
MRYGAFYFAVYHKLAGVRFDGGAEVVALMQIGCYRIVDELRRRGEFGGACARRDRVRQRRAGCESGRDRYCNSE